MTETFFAPYVLMNSTSMVSTTVAVITAASTIFATISAHAVVGGQPIRFTAQDTSTFDQFGWSVALDQGLALVGAVEGHVNGVGVGSAYLFDAATGTQLRKFVATDGAVGDQFGYSTALDILAGTGGLALIGTPKYVKNGIGSGAAYLFNATTGAQLVTLIPNGGQSSDEFGISVALDGGLALVGSRRDDNPLRDSGSAYLFNTTTGQQLFKLTPNDSARDEQFGQSVALEGNLAVVGSYLDDGGLGGAYIFDATTGSQLRKLIPTDSLGRIQFGISVAIDGGLVLVGSRGSRPDGVNTGVAYLFNAATGQQLAEFVANDTGPSDNFGVNVSIEGRFALLSDAESDGLGSNSGSAYVFDVITGNQLAKFTAADGAPGDLFGWSVAVDALPSGGGRALISTRFGDHSVTGSGSAYIFSIAAVPEPSTLVLIVAATITLPTRHRKSLRRNRV